VRAPNAIRRTTSSDGSRPGQCFAEHRLAGAAQHGPEDEVHDDRVVELAGHWEEVREMSIGMAR
jgi:hypothetical protein